MPKSSLRGYSKSGKLDEKEIKDKAKEMLGKDIDERDISGAEEIEDIVKKYEGKSEDELFSELKDIATKGRKDGSFNDDILKEFYKNVAPMMDKEQKKKLDGIVDMLKR